MSDKKLDLSRPTGTRDFLPADLRKHRKIERIVRESLEAFGFEEIMTPTFEFFDLFLVKSGEKFREETFTFKAPRAGLDGGDAGASADDARTFILRPEFTAPVCRFYIQSGLNIVPKPLKIFYVGPVFRYDKPAPGRFREFFQFGVEVFGIPGAIADAEIMYVATSIVKKLGIKDHVLRMNDLNILRELLGENDVAEDVQDKIIALMDKANGDKIKHGLGLLEETSPAEIELAFTGGLKDIGISPALVETLLKFLYLNGPFKEDVLPRAREVLARYTKALHALESSNLLRAEQLLDAGGITSRMVDLSLARGLDYYTGLVFEIDSPCLGKQKQICGGGRYDRLIRDFGGDDTPATGFAFGLDRLVLAAEMNGSLASESTIPRADVFLYAFKPELVPEAFKLQGILVENGIKVELSITDWNVKRALQCASKLDFPFALMLGEKEWKAGKNVVLKNLKTEQQEVVTLDRAIAIVKATLSPATS
ncbi:MAG: histidine--tRNA ligase [Candidatus Lokiarchaeota archaeon]|nr:histidine--tRNA ligase [Candidatus Lokiarchaeota archaeon]